MFGLGVIAALGAAGIKTAALLGSLGVAGLTIGFALRDTLSNIICGWISPSPWRSPKTWTGRG
jgi:small conductance mechanosensitive channel